MQNSLFQWNQCESAGKRFLYHSARCYLLHSINRAGIGIVEFDWLWELDRKLNELAMDATLAVIGAALISESLRFVAERFIG